MGVIKGDTRSLDHGSHRFVLIYRHRRGYRGIYRLI